MKPKILKLSSLVLLLLFIGASCQKDEWESIELNDNTCAGIAKSNCFLNNYSGVIGTLGAEYGAYFILADFPDSNEKFYLFPCNLPEKFYQEGLMIKFSGELFDELENENDSIIGDKLGDLILLSNVKIKK